MNYEKDLLPHNAENSEVLADGEIGIAQEALNADSPPTDVIFVVTDDEGVEHKLRMLTIFEAGAMKRQYVAGMTCDILLYNYKEEMVGNGERHFISEISNEVEYGYALKDWESILNNGVDEADIHEDTVYMAMLTDDGTTADIPITGTVFKIFKTDYEKELNKSYVAICPHNIMFYRYSEDMTEGRESVVISQIFSPQEYEDVSAEFHKMVVNENK